MNIRSKQSPEERLKVVASRFRYPPTPDVAGAVTKRLNSGSRPRVLLRSAWAVTGLLALVLVILFVVPGVRAEIVRFFQVGIVRILPAGATPTAISIPAQVPLTATPAVPGTQYEPLYSITVSGLAGETSLETTQASMPFPIRLPAYPADLGTPDRVFLQVDGQMVILVWTEPGNPEKAVLSLHEFGPEGMLLGKFEPRVIQETQVNGVYAVWVQGPYLVQLSSGAHEFRRTVEGNTLIWEENGITYRLESELSLDETIRIAESLR